MESIGENFAYDGECLEMLPCEHKVRINGEEKYMSAIEIIKECRKRNLPIPEHFQQYLTEDFTEFFE